MFVRFKTTNGNIALNTDFIFCVHPVDEGKTVVKINLSNKPETYIIELGYADLVNLLNDKPRIYSVVEPKSSVKTKPSIDIDKELDAEIEAETKASTKSSKGTK